MAGGPGLRGARDVLFGVAASGLILWVTFSASAGTLQVLTLVATVVAMIWIATVEAERLVDGRGRPNWLLFLLAGVGLAILVTGAVFLGGATILLVLLLGSATFVVGIVRAVRHGMRV